MAAVIDEEADSEVNHHHGTVTQTGCAGH